MMLATGTVSRMKSVGQMLVERGRNRIVGRDEQKRIAVGLRIDRGCRRDIAAGAGAILHHELLAEMLRQPLAHDARHDIDRAAGGKTDQPAHRAVRVVGSKGRGDAARKAQKADQADDSRAQNTHEKPLRCNRRMLSYKPGFAYIAFCPMFLHGSLDTLRKMPGDRK
jgi:hypothetical protein